MQFTKFLVAAAAFAVASAQTVKFTNSNFAGITVGSPFNITWAGATSDITLKLKNGSANAQNLVATIGTGLTGTSYSWTPASTLVNGVYNLEIDHGTDQPNYSEQFTISGGLTSSTAGSSTSASGTSTSTSTIASVTTTSTSTSTSASTSASTASSVSNSTSASKTATSTTSKSSSSSTSSSTSSVPSSNNAAQYASPFAFVLMTFVAIAALN